MSALHDYDTGPLNWVRGDIDAALQAALGRVQAFSVDADLTNALRLAHDDAHQATGALRMVGLEGAATLSATLESSLDDINESRVQANDEILRALRNAIEGLQRWVKDLADGRGSGELALFPLYKRLRELQGAERVFEGELFFPDLRSRTQGKAVNNGMTQEALAAEVKKNRAQFQRGLLAFLRNVEAEQGLTRMRDALAAIERIAPSQASQTFWWACVGFVDSLIARGVEADFHVKQLLARVDLQMRRLMEGSPQVAERLMRDALFFVAKSQPSDGRGAEVRSTFGLDRYLPGRGMLDPESLARMRPVLDALQSGLKAARDNWHAFVDGNADQLEQFHVQLERMHPQAQSLSESHLKPLLDELASAANFAARNEGDIRDQVNLEVASALLFMQNAIDQEDVLHTDFSDHADSQSERLRALVEGRELPASVMEATSQREAERDMLVHLAQEVGQNLKQMEEALDAFFRDETEREALAGLPALAQQAQGALTMLELPDAASLLAAATAAVEPYASEGHPDEATQQRLADAFSSLGLYIESYCAGRSDAGRILRPVLIEFGVIDADTVGGSMLDDSIESGLPARKDEVVSAYLGWRDVPDDGTKKKFLDALTELGRDAELIDDDILKRQTRAALDLSRDAVDAPVQLDAAIATLCGQAVPERAVIESPLNPDALEQVGGEDGIPLATDENLETTDEVDASSAELAETDHIDINETAEDIQPAPAIEFGAVEPEFATEADTPTAGAAADASKESLLLSMIPEGVEQELLEIFLEEANEVLATMGEACDVCQNHPDDLDSQTVIRRGFHTLKGSGRMVGLEQLGETAWRLEQLMNGWLADKKPASRDLLRLIERSRGVFQDWVDALQGNQSVGLPVQALLDAVERVSQGHPLDVAPSPEVEIEAPVQDISTPEAASVSVGMDAGMPADATAPEQEAEAIIEAEDAPAIAENISIEADVGPVATEVGARVEWARAPVDEPAAGFDEFHDAEPLESSAADEVAESAPLADASEPAEVEMARMEALVQPDEPAAVMDAPVLDVGAIIEYAEAGESIEQPLPPDEVCIGPVSMSANLYEIFMVEAHQRLAVLQDEVAHHADMANSAVSEHARRAIHTLGGIAGTAGISALAELSHALEQYWNRFVRAALPSAHLPLVQDTVARLHEMIASIESGQLPDAAYDLIATLGELEDESAPPVPDDALDQVVETVVDGLPVDLHTDAPTEEAVSETAAIHDLSAGIQMGTTSGALDVSALVPDVRHAATAPVFERREVADEIDQQLLPIFLEEAETLIPDTSAQLRAWMAAPGDTTARNALQRNLHTIKGSARMVGAMRLGELTHVMESRVIAVIEGHLNASAEVFGTLEAQIDRVADVVERMKQGDFSPVGNDADKPLEAPIEPVLPQGENTPVATADPLTATQAVTRESNALTLRVRADWVDRMVNQAGEVAIARSRIESEVFAFKRHVNELTEALVRLRGHIREVEIQAESQMQATFQAQGATEEFDPLEFDRFTRFQEVTRFLAESVNDISTVQHILLARLGEADAALIQQTRLNRELQQDLLRVRMVPLYSVAERLYRTVRQTARDVGKRAQLDIQGGDLEIDRSVLEKVTAPLEHLLRNALAHGVESPEERRAAGKAEFGEIILSARQSGNEMMLTVKDDGAGLNFARIREKAEANGLLLPGVEPTETLLSQMIFAAGFSTAEEVSQVA
ncbi:MAG: Hpt domain-containing protein, partial [Thiobacillus sp.]|nr:Hpt domain-containing protein [Thiobacillus sp.]